MSMMIAVAAVTPLRGNERRLLSAEPIVARGTQVRAARSKFWTWETAAVAEAGLVDGHEPRLEPELPVAEGQMVWLAGPEFVSAWQRAMPVLSHHMPGTTRDVNATVLDIQAWSRLGEMGFVAGVGNWWTTHLAGQSVARACLKAVRGAVARRWDWTVVDLQAIQTVALGIDEALEVYERLLTRALVCSLTDDTETWSRVAREAAARLSISRADFRLRVKYEIDSLLPAARGQSPSPTFSGAPNTDEDEAALSIGVEPGALL